MTTHNQQKTPLKRAKVQLQFPEKLFYECALAEWRDTVLKNGAKNHAFVLRKALCNLKLFPLDVNGFADLRKIRGIGLDIATRLDAAWKFARDVHFANPLPTISQVNALSKGEALAILEGSSTQNGAKLPFVGGTQKSKDSAKVTTKKQPLNDKNGKDSAIQSTKGSNSQDFIIHGAETLDADDYEHLLNGSVSQPAMFFEFEDPSTSPKKLAAASSSLGSACFTSLKHNNMLCTTSQQHILSTDDVACCSSSASSQPSSKPLSELLLSHFPTQTAQSQLLLITDNREHIAGARGGARRGKGIAEHLIAMNVTFESRSLSIGDYIWLLQWTDLEGKRQELVLDYVLERKTLDDLKRSIRETRYLEQKQRLQRCGLRNVVLVVEGVETAGDRSLEQAMVSSGVESGFLVHRTANMQSTAKLLQQLTKRLQERCATEKVTGPSFATLQEECRKSHACTVAECWLRQLTVCPGMSTERAHHLRQRFPTFRSLVEFYREKGSEMNDEIGKDMLMSDEVAQLPVSVSKYIHTFLEKALAE